MLKGSNLYLQCCENIKSCMVSSYKLPCIFINGSNNWALYPTTLKSSSTILWEPQILPTTVLPRLHEFWSNLRMMQQDPEQGTKCSTITTSSFQQCTLICRPASSSGHSTATNNVAVEQNLQVKQTTGNAPGLQLLASNVLWQTVVKVNVRNH